MKKLILESFTILTLSMTAGAAGSASYCDPDKTFPDIAADAGVKLHTAAK